MTERPDSGAIACLRADWPAPPGILALCTTRLGGVSAAPYESFNLATHVGDAPASVAANRRRLQSLVGLESAGLESAIPWLNQVHGSQVAYAGEAAHGLDADALWSDTPGAPCAVLTADCLPVLLCALDGSCVAAAHAGWRGLAGGVLEAVIDALPRPGRELMAWLGPAIGPGAFEVGQDVLEAFTPAAGEPRAGAAIRACFAPSPGRPGHYLADLYALARLRLATRGVTRVFGGGLCTYSDATRFYSYRRDGETGRMASLILIKNAA